MVNFSLVNGPRIINSKSTRRLPCSYYIQMKRIPSKFIIMFSSKFNFFWLVRVLYLFWCAGCSNINISCAVTDKEALLKLKDGFVDGGGRLSTWKSEADCCEWNGVVCSNLTGHVIKLDLVHYGDSEELRGNIDSSLCDLQHLTYLYLDGNNFEGSKIPECIGSLGQLRELTISGASIGGTIPRGLQNLSNLQTLDLSDNPFKSGPFPDFSRFSNLVTLSLKNTSLHGSIPQSFGHLAHLSKLYLSYNNLTGSLPTFAGLASLEYLDLSNNRLNSVINETHLSTLSNLTVLGVSQNTIFFNFSSHWVPPFQLQDFIAASCNFGGHFPSWLKYQRELHALEISDASISDSIPQWLWLSSFNYLNLSHNKLYGELPKSILKFYHYVLDLSFNNLSSPIPDLPTSAMALVLSNSMFLGTLSFICATAQGSVYQLDISCNFLSGKLPDCGDNFLTWPF
ncbi:receptor-like protein EIX2 [Neltuma alba]|uniref:receptor-like protein EIX2 n=1 Tax=Neltuma alba TaxID=207710 RepID=UPI0010A311C7|nr:receptor-like protein EIX2 [Prosopis alba]